MKLFKSFNKFKDNIALIDNKNTKISYKEILNQSNKIKKKNKKKIINSNYIRKFHWVSVILHILYTR